MREKLSKAKPRDIKGVVCRGLPWGLFWPGNSLAGPVFALGKPDPAFTRAPRLITFQTFVPFHPVADAGRMRSASGQRESAANRRLETHGGKPKG